MTRRMQARSAGATWQGWDRRTRRRRIALAIVVWIMLVALAVLAVVGAWTLVSLFLIVAS